MAAAPRKQQDRQVWRLSQGGRIDRSRPLDFKFNGRRYRGYSGDTLASALLANGLCLIGRSFKFHRPRGIVGSGAEEPNAIVQLGHGAATEPNLRTTEVLLHDGLIASSVRGWPGLHFDLLAVNDRFHRLLAAGFYYKTFLWPDGLWPWYEHAIRKISGLGRAPQLPDPDHYAHHNAHCDLLVAGGGPAGLMAALAAGRAGARVIIADEQGEFGGSLLHSSASINGAAVGEWLQQVLAELAQCPEVVLLPRSTVLGYYDYNFLTILQHCREHPQLASAPGSIRQRLWRVRARRVILAQGALERPLVFCNNDRPGVMMASAVSHYIRRYAVCPGSRGLIFTNNDSAYQVALDLAAAGASVAALVDCRPGGGALAGALQEAGIEVLAGYVVTDVRGARRVRAAQVQRIAEDGKTLLGAPATIHCDLLAMSGGWNPSVHLHSQAGGELAWDSLQACFVPARPRWDHVSVGAANGSFDLASCLEEGKLAGLLAAQQCGFEPPSLSTPSVPVALDKPLQALWRTPSAQPPERCPRQFIDYQNDTTAADIFLAAREGFHSVEHVKRYTALGFGTDQGKLGNINGAALLAERLNRPIAEVGTTKFRPLYTPASFGACAGADVGELYEPVRKTALHQLHVDAGAEFEVVGQWLRPWYFPNPGEDKQAALVRECLAARRSVAIMDASTLGKIEVQGPDSETFLDRIYTHDIGKLRSGRCAYGIMLGEDGMIMDDGVMARLGEQHFYLTTTTGGAARVLSWLEQWLQTEWPQLQVYLTTVTDHWSTIALVGPGSRKLLQSLDSNIAFEQADFPFMSVHSGNLAGFDVRVFRVSFSGELAFEINVESDSAAALWQLLIQTGRAFGITPYGTETMHVLRAEKGFVIVGQDTDGSVSPLDLGMNWLLSGNKDFLGKRSLSRSDSLRPGRRQLVGLLSADGTTVVPEGTQLIERPGGVTPVPMKGYVTSSYWSACLGHPIALALADAGRSRHGDRLYAALRDGRYVEVELVSPVFYDPRGERQSV